MKALSVISSVSLGPWKMPQRAQTACINLYAKNQGLEVRGVVSEYVFSTEFPNLYSKAKESGVRDLVFVSIYQVPRGAALERFLEKYAGFNLHFALEDMCFRDGDDVTKFTAELEALHQITICDKNEALTGSIRYE